MNALMLIVLTEAILRLTAVMLGMIPFWEL